MKIQYPPKDKRSQFLKLRYLIKHLGCSLCVQVPNIFVIYELKRGVLAVFVGWLMMVGREAILRYSENL